MDRKLESIEQKEQNLTNRQKELQKKFDDLDALIQKQVDDLERISGMTRDEAKDLLLKNIERTARHDAALLDPGNRAGGQGRGREKGKQHHRAGHSAVRRGSRGRNHRVGGTVAQR